MFRLRSWGHPLSPMSARASPSRLKSPWRAVRSGEAFIVEDANGYPILYIYFEDEPTRASTMGRMSSDMARRVARNVARLPKLLGKG